MMREFQTARHVLATDGVWGLHWTGLRRVLHRCDSEGRYQLLWESRRWLVNNGSRCYQACVFARQHHTLSILNKHPEIRTKRPWESRRLSWAELAACHVQDLANYSPGWAEPIHVTYRGYDIYSNPSTTRGGLEVLMGLNLLEGWDISSYGDPNHPMVLHLQVGDLQSSCTTSAVCPYDSTVYCHVPSHTGMHMLLV